MDVPPSSSLSCSIRHRQNSATKTHSIASITTPVNLPVIVQRGILPQRQPTRGVRLGNADLPARGRPRALEVQLAVLGAVARRGDGVGLELAERVRLLDPPAAPGDRVGALRAAAAGGAELCHGADAVGEVARGEGVGGCGGGEEGGEEESGEHFGESMVVFGGKGKVSGGVKGG